VPADLGYYDLRLPEVREQQAQMARDAGIEGFCYWHYWFGNGKRLLERPFNEVLKSGKPDFPFCLGWANHSWLAKNWNATAVKGKDKILIEQTYPGEDDFVKHFEEILPAFKDHRYIYVDNKPLFLIWDTENLPEFSSFSNLWNTLAKKHGLDGIYFVGYSSGQTRAKKSLSKGFDAVCLDLLMEAEAVQNRFANIFRIIYNRVFLQSLPRLYNYSNYVNYSLDVFAKITVPIIPCLLPNYDHTPRSKENGVVLTKSTPHKFGYFLKKILTLQNNKDKKIIFIKSWNEWGEGNYLEPDMKYGNNYLREIKKVIKSSESDYLL
jgi:hypothetical protein